MNSLKPLKPLKPIDTALKVAEILLMSRQTYSRCREIIYILDDFIEDKTVEEKEKFRGEK